MTSLGILSFFVKVHITVICYNQPKRVEGRIHVSARASGGKNFAPPERVEPALKRGRSTALHAACYLGWRAERTQHPMRNCAYQPARDGLLLCQLSTRTALSRRARPARHSGCLAAAEILRAAIPRIIAQRGAAQSVYPRATRQNLRSSFQMGSLLLPPLQHAPTQPSVARKSGPRLNIHPWLLRCSFWAGCCWKLLARFSGQVPIARKLACLYASRGLLL